MIPGAPTPVGPFSHATEADGWVFLTGQMPILAHRRRRTASRRRSRADERRVMDNPRAGVCKGLDLGLQHVVAARIFLTEFKRDYAAMNEIYRVYFPADALPARTCIGVTALARDALVEIDFIARRPG